MTLRQDGPLAARRVGPKARNLQATLCGYDRHEAGRALVATIDLYRRWSDADGTIVERRHHAEKLAMRYLHDLIDQGR